MLRHEPEVNWRVGGYQAEYPHRDTTPVCTTYTYKLQSTPEQERERARVVRQCRALYKAALAQRITGWRRGQGSNATRFEQEAELKDLRAAFAAYTALHSHVLQDVLARLARAYHDFFRRLAAGEHPGFPRFQGGNR